MKLNAPAVLGLCLSAIHSIALPQPRPAGSGDGWGHHGAYHRSYDPKTVETFRGKVLAIDTFTLAPGGRAGIHLRVHRKKDTVDVHLGPRWFLENQESEFSAGDTVEVKGSRITFNGKPAIIAAEVKKGGATLILRKADGYPAWSGWRRRD